MLTKIVGGKPKLLILNKGSWLTQLVTRNGASIFESRIKLWLSTQEQVTVKVVTDARPKLMADRCS